MWQTSTTGYNAVTRPNVLVAGLFIGFVLAVLVVSGFFGEPAQTVLPPGLQVETPLVRATFKLGGTSFAIVLPQAAEIGDSRDRSAVTISDFTRGKRLQRQMRIATAFRDADASYDLMMPLAHGGRLDYQVTDNIGGGSGGPIGELVGRVEIGPLVLSVACTDQDGLGYPQPAWCLRYLKRLEVVRRGL